MIKLVILFYIFLISISSFKGEVYKKFSIILKGKATLNSSIIKSIGNTIIKKSDIINFEANNTYSSDTSYCSNYVGCYNYDDGIICRHYVDGNKINEEQTKAINKSRIYKRSKKEKKYSFFNISIKSFQNCKNNFRKKKEHKYKERKNKNTIYSSKSLYNDNINTKLEEYEHG
ncbi:hypothetical protein PFLG_01852 [Plasmodium falciparum RAJ116]|uniref:Uncharacterized protein n=1 Tax=Plasmodium falciparum RAJ116 TaxID=580058 RepID=A0A0L0CZE3_PLAFA|nr:hypothetical protein PFLG_01852 [Plasmodium falciparum RAJ116]